MRITDNNILSGSGAVPMGFGMALAQNFSALDKFSTLPDVEKKEIIEGARNVSSKQEMRSYVSSIADR